jgi:2-polyprenyl-6-methoxyphenol hydroxylase-like FAD-dependent oxidoreductase
MDEFKTSGGNTPKPPAPHLDTCPACAGSGLARCENAVKVDFKKFPNVAIIGGGIGGVALAVACLHRGIPFTLYERDASFDSRSQGYGLTLQQASKAIEGLGIFSLEGGITSTRHVVHTQDGKVIGEWGLRRWKIPFLEKTTKRRNVHIARQSLRRTLLQNLGGSSSVQWGHILTGFSHNDDGTVDLTFQVNGEIRTTNADLVVGADGIRSRVRELAIGEHLTPLTYLGCIVMLGICPLDALGGNTSPLLDSATVFQTVNGHERMYMMPFDADTIMWQLSFPLSEQDAKELSAQGAKAMKKEALRRLSSWHDPIPRILATTSESDITGYPVYDRELFDPALLHKQGGVTLIGDAAHPMSPFKGQGANQAILDALTLARKIYEECSKNSRWREAGIRNCVLNDFEKEMAARSASKVEGSAQAVHNLHSGAVLFEGDETRG